MDEQPPQESTKDHAGRTLLTPVFGPAADVAVRYLMAASALIVLFGAYFWYAFARSDYLTGVGVPVTQPVLFSHRHHAGDLGISCLYCHTSVENSAFAGMPSTETCMTCHSQLFTDSPMLEPVRASFASGVPIAWNRVHDLPEFTYFHHGIHVSNGIDCAQCHGEVADMALVHKVETLHMEWCLECHRETQPTLPPPLPQWTGPGEESVVHHALEHPVNPLTNCSVCHR